MEKNESENYSISACFQIEAYSPHSVNELWEMTYYKFFQRILHRMLISQNILFKKKTKTKFHGKITSRNVEIHIGFCILKTENWEVQSVCV